MLLLLLFVEYTTKVKKRSLFYIETFSFFSQFEFLKIEEGKLYFL